MKKSLANKLPKGNLKKGKENSALKTNKMNSSNQQKKYEKDFSKSISVYTDRQDPAYLKKLLGLIKNIEETKIKRPKEYGGNKYTHCIEINFAGLACRTLLLDKELDEKKMSDERTEVREAFKTLLSEENLGELNKRGIYVRIRFAFNYLYSDYPICLMKAELEDNWHENVKNEDGKQKRESNYDYYISKPIDEGEFVGSAIFTSQRDSLIAIKDLCSRKNNLLALGRPQKAINTIQVRFPVIPSPLCTLMINGDTAITDPYIYSKLENKTRLNVNYPVIMVKKNTPQFESIMQNFYYLWRHDLTLFAEDGTYLNKPGYGGIGGLVKIMEPSNKQYPITWEHKARRIMERRNNPHDDEFFSQPDTIEHKQLWRNNLKKKLKMCTRKGLKESTNDEGNQTEMEKPQEKIKPLIISKLEIGVVVVNDHNRRYSFEVGFEGGETIKCSNIKKVSMRFVYLFQFAYFAHYKKKVKILKYNTAVGNETLSKVRPQVRDLINNHLKKANIKGRASDESLFINDHLNVDSEFVTIIGEEYFSILINDSKNSDKFYEFEDYFVASLEHLLLQRTS